MMNGESQFGELVNSPRTEFGRSRVVSHAGLSQANQFDADRQASCRSKKQLAFRVAHRDKAITFLPTTLRRGTHRNAIRLRTCKRTDENREYVFCFVKCEEGPSECQMNQGDVATLSSNSIESLHVALQVISDGMSREEVRTATSMSKHLV
jgi:hypothetical protein